MVKRETGLARTARLLDLVPYLTTHQGVEISELAKTFKTTVTYLYRPATEILDKTP